MDDPLSDAVLHRKFATGTHLVLSLNSDGAVTVRTAEEEADAADAHSERLGQAHLAQHPSGVDGGILVTVGPDGGNGNGNGHGYETESSRVREAVMMRATVEEN